MVDFPSAALGAGSIIGLQVAWSISRVFRNGAPPAATGTAAAEHQFLDVEVVETFDGLRFRKTGTDEWLWTGNTGPNIHERWEAADWNREGVFSHFRLTTYYFDALDAAKAKAETLMDRLVANMHWEAHRIENDRQRAAFIERVAT